MGVGGKFWDLLKPYSRNEGFDFLRNKRVAVDLSFWIVQHETAIRDNARNPHLRLTFFRTINLFSKFGAFPVFVVDGTPSPLKSKARIARFCRVSGIDPSSLPAVDDDVSVERNYAFLKCVQECVELLELFGMPVLRAKGEAEALCAHLDSEGHVDACITSDSDAFLFGAKCVIKCFRMNSKEPFECYYMSDIEAGLGLKRKHLTAIALLVGNDHDIKGVQGIGLENALCFVQMYSEDDILNRLHEIGNKETFTLQFGVKPMGDLARSVERLSLTNCSHCSFCGHPGNIRDHLKYSCEFCSPSIGGGCLKKPAGFRCDCSSCDANRKEKEQKEQQCWLTKVCTKIAIEPNFPNNDIIKMYLCDNNGYFTENGGPCLSWGSPKTELLVDFLTVHQHWDPSYVRQRILPMLSTIFLREMASTIFLREMDLHHVKSLLYGNYEFDSIDRVKIRYGHQFYVVRWRKAVPAMGSGLHTISSEVSDLQQDVLIIDEDETVNLLDELDVPKVHFDEGCHFLLTDENMDLVQSAFPKEVNGFLQKRGLKESRRKKTSSSRCQRSNEKLETGHPSITNFFRSTKTQVQAETREDSANNIDCENDGTSKDRKRKVSNPNLPKPLRRRLLFG
ncbi:hypothetical protein UlMin_030550 [Ulmus minor]